MSRTIEISAAPRAERRPRDLSLEGLEAQGKPVSTWDVPPPDRVEFFDGDPEWLYALLLIETALEANPHLISSVWGQLDRVLARWERRQERELYRRRGERPPKPPPTATRWRELYAADLEGWPRLRLALDGSLDMVFLEAGLPAEEAKVVRWVLNGYSLERTAEIMRISRQHSRSLHSRGMARILGLRNVNPLTVAL